MISTLLKRAEPRVQGIGIGSIGPMNLKKGTLMKPPNLPFNSVPLTEARYRGYFSGVFEDLELLTAVRAVAGRD